MTPPVMLTPYNKYIHNKGHSLMTTAYQTQIEDTTYNGWTNYETWNVALWMGNDEFLYNTAKACVLYAEFNECPYEKFIRCMHNCDSMTTGDGVKWDDPSVNAAEIVEAMEEF